MGEVPHFPAASPPTGDTMHTDEFFQLAHEYKLDGHRVRSDAQQARLDARYTRLAAQQGQTFAALEDALMQVIHGRFALADALGW